MASLLTQTHQQFINQLKNQHRSTNTILAYGKDIAQFLVYLNKNHKTTSDQIATEDITSFQTSLAPNYTVKSISRKLNSIKTFCRFLNQNGDLKHNPASQIHSPTLSPTTPRILTKVEYRALRDAARDDLRLAAVVELLLQTGLRIGELGHLKLEHINKDKTAITVRPYESHSGRTVPLNSAARQALDKYLKDRPRSRDNTLFITKTGHPFLIRNIRSSLNRLFKKAGIAKATVNDLRHTFISAQIQAGTPLNFIAQIVGHKRLSTTEQYLKYVKPGSQKSAIQLEEL